MNWKKKIFTTGMVLGVALGVLGCGSEATSNSANTSAIAQDKTMSFDEKVDAMVASMTTKEKVGQLVMIGIHGNSLNDDNRYMLTQFHTGGVILFDRNIESAEQVKKLTQDLQANAQQKLPLFIGIDEEGGKVVRGTNVIDPPPAQAAIGATGDVTKAEGYANRVGTQLKKLGINVNFAPVADVGGTLERSYSSDPTLATKFVQAAAQGYEQTHIMYALKHFPGIGRGVVDSHQDISAIDASEAELMASDLVPFKTIIDKNSPEDYFILVSHLKYPALDAQNPASQSKAIMTDLLRNKLGFDGIIITDDMEMGAVAKYDSYRQLGAKAIIAGADMVMMCHEYEHEQDVYMGILEAVESGQISKERLDESVRRIVKAKMLHLLN